MLADIIKETIDNTGENEIITSTGTCRFCKQMATKKSANNMAAGRN